jgi:predicted RNase H-like HicB family nuclease
MAKKPPKYTVTDGELVLVLEPEDKWYCVTSSVNPDIITQAQTLEEAFEMARDVIQTYKAYRAKKQTPVTGPTKPGNRSGKSVVKKNATRSGRVKRLDLEMYLQAKSCQFHYHGVRHNIWINYVNNKTAPVSWHKQIAKGTVRSICKQLGAPIPGGL